VYERRFALTVIDRAMARLAVEVEASGDATRFARLRQLLVDTGDGYAAAAAELGMTEGAVKVAVHRLRKRQRELLRDEVAELVGDEEAVDEELASLLSALREGTPG
jgi:RNA polymerase sigma-70 factor (ECF subfamily)